MNRELLEQPFAPAQIRQRKGRNGLLDYVEGHTVVKRLIQNEVDGAPGCDRGELFQQLDGVEEEMGGAVAPGALECDEHSPVGAELDAVLGERGVEERAAELFEAGAVVGGDRDLGVEVEASELGLAGTAWGDVTDVRLVAEEANAAAGARAEGDAALHGLAAAG